METRNSGIVLKEGQAKAVKRVTMWYNFEDNLICRIGGYAGTGKSFIIKYIIKEIGLDMSQVEFCAFTGNATVNLIRKGNKTAKTVHKLIYNTIVEEIPVYVNTKTNKEVDKDNVVSTNGIYRTIDTFEAVEIARYDKVCYTELKPCLDNSMCKLIVCDEYSMLSNKMINDLKSFNIKILLVGDRGQLPPVNASNSYIDDYEAELTEIVRQEKDNPIIDASILARNKIAIAYGDYGNEDELVSFYPTEMFFDHTKKLIKWADQIIVGKNATRKRINSLARSVYGFTGRVPNIGEKVVCNANSWSTLAYSPYLGTFIPLVNGSRGYVKDIKSIDTKKKEFIMDFQIDFDEECIFKDLVVSFMNFDEDCKFADSEAHQFDYGYAITCHKSQGNQYGKVLVIAESFWIPELKGIDIEKERKWLYTAITRAEKELMVFYDNKYYKNKGYEKDDNYYNAIDYYYE